MWKWRLTFWRGILALFFRSLRTESRSLRIHLLWLLLMLVIYASLGAALSASAMFGAPGLLFFKYVVYLDAAFITLLGVSFFSTVISEEKEEDTLGLMTMAGIGPLGILLGKSTSRLFQVSLLLAIQYPFTLLAVTMGGLMPTQIFSAYMSLLAYAILLANVGLLCSVACRTNRSASGLTTFWTLGYLVVPVFASAGWSHLTYVGWRADGTGRGLVLAVLDWTSRSSVFTDLYHATLTAHQFHWSVQIVGNAVGGVVCFLLAWPLFGFVSKEPVTDSASRGMVALITSRRLRWLSAGRAWNQPLIWKDFFFTASGWGGLLVRCGLYGGLYAVCYSANRSPSFGPMRWEYVTHGFQSFAHPLLAVDIALCASRVFHDEIKGQTLSSLLMLPKSIPELVYCKVIGCGLATLPGISALLLTLAMPGGWDFGNLTDQPYFWWWIMNLLLMIHLTGLFSMYLRSGAFALALGTTVGLMILTGIFAEMLVVQRNSLEWIFGLSAVLIGVVCAACHGIILRRMPILGEK